MSDRKLKIQELLTDLRSMRRGMSLHSTGSAKTPRITPSQWGVLMHVEQEGKSTVKHVSQALRMSSSAATQLVDGLVRSGYLTRQASPEDRRIVVLSLSKKSERRIQHMKQEALQKFLKFFAHLNDKELDLYIKLNKKLIQGFLSKNERAIIN